MAIVLTYDHGQTALDDEEKEGLKIPTITSRKELDEFEQLNIQEAVEWTLSRRWKSERVFSQQFLMELHKRMYGRVWTWAGKFRLSNKNIGVAYYQIAHELKMLLDDAKFWVENNTFSPDEIAIRFKHRLVAIHCFPNGNGRHSRLIADIIIDHIFKKDVYSWGNSALLKADEVRKVYINALKAADGGKLGALINFSRS